MAETPARHLLCTLNATTGLRHGTSMSKLLPRRHLSTETEPPETDHHGTRWVDCLLAPLNLSTWKEGYERKRSAEKLHRQYQSPSPWK